MLNLNHLEDKRVGRKASCLFVIQMSWGWRNTKCRQEEIKHETTEEYLKRGGEIQTIKSFKGVEAIQYCHPGPHLATGQVPGCYYPKLFGLGCG